MSCGSSLTSVNVLYPEPNPSSDERIVGDDASEEVELGSLECPRREKVGVVGEDRSDVVEEREGCCTWSSNFGDTGPMSSF